MTAAPASLDIVIPTYNEADGITAMLASLDTAVEAARSILPEFKIATIVVDGGSSDSTRQQVAECGFQCLESPKKGRGNQIAHGINHLSGEWILILHGDCLVKSEALTELYNALAEKDDVGWGIIGHDYDESGFLFWLTRLMNRRRFDSKGLGYGDQGQFVNRSILEDKGGFPRIPLMEDVELSLLLENVPRIRLGEWLIASSRQWRKKGFWRYSIQNLKYAKNYIRERRSGRSASQLAEALYDRYYSSQ